MAILNLACEKVWFTINGPSKMYFFNFCLFPFSTFEMTFVKNLIMDFEGFLGSSTMLQIFLICTFLTMKRRSFQVILKFAQKCILFLSFFFFLNTTTPYLMIYLKCTAKNYDNLNSSSISKLFLNYRPLNMLFRSF